MLVTDALLIQSQGLTFSSLFVIHASLLNKLKMVEGQRLSPAMKEPHYPNLEAQEAVILQPGMNEVEMSSKLCEDLEA